MTHAPQDNSTEQRRRLLKGALGASTVVTLGYGAPVAASSLNCVAKVIRDGGHPANTNQFFLGDLPPASTPGNWAWKEVTVNMYSGGIEGFVADGVVYSTDSTLDHRQLTGVTVVPTPNYPKKGWVLVYFDKEGGEAGTYPAKNAGAGDYAPASASCLNSINPGVMGDYKFGG